MAFTQQIAQQMGYIYMIAKQIEYSLFYRLWILRLFEDSVLKASLKFKFLKNLGCKNTGKPEIFVQLIHHSYFISVKKLRMIVVFQSNRNVWSKLESLISSRRFALLYSIKTSVLTPGQSRSNSANI